MGGAKKTRKCVENEREHFENYLGCRVLPIKVALRGAFSTSESWNIRQKTWDAKLWCPKVSHFTWDPKRGS